MSKFCSNDAVPIAVYRWLAKDEDDGLIVRELPLGGTSLLNSAFLLTTFICYPHN